jgi:hypothetical protein
LLPKAQSLLDQGADPNHKLTFAFVFPLPTSIELAQQLNYQKIINTFSAYSKQKIK